MIVILSADVDTDDACAMPPREHREHSTSYLISRCLSRIGSNQRKINSRLLERDSVARQIGRRRWRGIADGN